MLHPEIRRVLSTTLATLAISTGCASPHATKGAQDPEGSSAAGALTPLPEISESERQLFAVRDTVGSRLSNNDIDGAFEALGPLSDSLAATVAFDYFASSEIDPAQNVRAAELIRRLGPRAQSILPDLGDRLAQQIAWDYTNPKSEVFLYSYPGRKLQDDDEVVDIDASVVAGSPEAELMRVIDPNCNLTKFVRRPV